MKAIKTNAMGNRTTIFTKGTKKDEGAPINAKIEGRKEISPGKNRKGGNPRNSKDVWGGRDSPTKRG